MPDQLDFTAFVPINGSSENGYLSINSELIPGGVSILDIQLSSSEKKWQVSASQAINFSSVGGTAANCSGAVTPWGTVISCEEAITTQDENNDNYNDYGWAVEIDPVSKTVIDKLWAMGNFKHENVAIHSNRRTVYQGADSTPGYLYKFVADQSDDLGSGKLFVYTGPKSGDGGSWIQLNNTTPAERNSTLQQSEAAGATVFEGIEDVEIGPDGKIYFAVKNECVVYRFDDSDPLTGTTVSNFETFVGGRSYNIEHGSGTSSAPWGCGNDNLAFDGQGNLWVLQDGGDNNIWVVGSTHAQANPDVRIFARTPEGSEPTGITFTPDYKYLFMSIQHPSGANNANQTDAFGKPVDFDADMAIVIAREENFGGPTSCPTAGTSCDDGDPNTTDDMEDGNCNCIGTSIDNAINHFVLINANTDQNITTIEDGDVFTLEEIGTDFLGIKAITIPDPTGSVRLELTGLAQFQSRLENVAPYSLFGDNGNGDIYGEVFAPGAYTITATPYSESGANGQMGATRSATFTIAGANQYMVTLTDDGNGNASIDPANGPYPENTQLTLTATPNAGFQFQSWTNAQGSVISNQNPFSFSISNDISLKANFIEEPCFGQNLVTYYEDADGDGFGNPSVTLVDCTQPDGFVSNDTDCNDNNPSINPDATEVCDGADNNCDGIIDDQDPQVNCSEIAVTGIILVDASLNVDIGPITNGEQIPFSSIPNEDLSIRVETSGPIGSVWLQLSGPKSASRTENVAPYALFGDRGEDFIGASFPIGVYTFTATPYTENSRKGEMGAAVTVTFELYNGPTVSYTLSLMNDGNGSTSATPSAGPYPAGTTITVSASPGSGFQFLNWVDGQNNVVSTANPYVFQINSDTDLKANFTPVQLYSLSLSSDGNGSASASPAPGPYEAGTTITVSASPGSGFQFLNWVDSQNNVVSTANPYVFQITGNITITANFQETPAGPAVTSFTLIDPSTNQDILDPISDGSIITQSSINIRANTTASGVKSVVFSLKNTQGQTVKSKTESAAPYALYGDSGGNYSSGTLPNDTYTLTATPYSENGGGGSPGTSLTISFTVNTNANIGQRLPGTYNANIASEKTNALEIELFPNPAYKEVTINWKREAREEMQISIYNQFGQRLKTRPIDALAPPLATFNIQGLPAGVYFVEVYTSAQRAIKKLVISQ